MDEKNVLASCLIDNELARAFSNLVADRWDNWDLSPFMTYLVDVCSENALPYLADQFDVDGIKGFTVVDEVGQQRELIKKSIELHKYIGTPWAIREACRTIGFPVILIEEGVRAVAGGPEDENDWARFRVLVDADLSKYVTEEQARKVRLFVEFYKNERSHLVELGFGQNFEENLYRDPKDERDDLAIISFVIDHRQLLLDRVLVDPAGTESTLQVTSTVPWKLADGSFGWNDGSGDRLYVEYTGEEGTSIIKVTSDRNQAQERDVDIPVFSEEGRQIGYIPVKQLRIWKNAYSWAYSNAYNLLTPASNAYCRAYSRAYNYEPFLNLSKENIFFSADAPFGDNVIVRSNTDWIVK